jgi:exosortase
LQVREYKHNPGAVREMVIADDGSLGQRWLAFVIAMPVLAGLLGYAYWSTIVGNMGLLETWKNSIDYHHGFFVAPFVAYFLWVRRDTFPVKQSKIDAALGIFLGLALLLFWGVFRYYVMVWSMVTLDSWTILVWVWAVSLMCFGIRVFIWALPSLVFLAFMFPWPPSVETQMRGPLQQFAAQLSVYILRTLGEPAIAQANIVLMSDNQHLDVEAACSGIRVLVSVIAAAYATALLMRRPWWQNLLLFCLVVPVALFVNALRIAMTGLLIKHASEQVESFGFAKKTSVVCDEISGMAMLILTFVMFVVIVWWFGLVFRRVEISEQQTRIRQSE